MSIHNDIGDNIIEIRKSKNLTQEKLALESEISLSYLRLIEHGKANPTINELLKISHALNFDFQNPFSVNLASSKLFRIPMPVTDIIFLGNNSFSVCPRCHNSLERDFQTFCDRCGQALLWKDFKF